MSINPTHTVDPYTYAVIEEMHQNPEKRKRKIKVLSERKEGEVTVMMSRKLVKSLFPYGIGGSGDKSNLDKVDYNYLSVWLEFERTCFIEENSSRYFWNQRLLTPENY